MLNHRTARRADGIAPVLGRLEQDRRNARSAAAAPANRRAPETGGGPRSLDLIADWGGDKDILRDAIDMASDWSPFELIGVTPVRGRTNGARRHQCLFYYHGPAAEFDHWSEVLVTALSKVAPFEPAAPAK